MMGYQRSDQRLARAVPFSAGTLQSDKRSWLAAEGRTAESVAPQKVFHPQIMPISADSERAAGHGSGATGHRRPSALTFGVPPSGGKAGRTRVNAELRTHTTEGFEGTERPPAAIGFSSRGDAETGGGQFHVVSFPRRRESRLFQPQRTPRVTEAEGHVEFGDSGRVDSVHRSGHANMQTAEYPQES